MYSFQAIKLWIKYHYFIAFYFIKIICHDNSKCLNCLQSKRFSIREIKHDSQLATFLPERKKFAIT